MIRDNKLLIANGRQVAVTIHRLKSLEEGAEDFAIDVQVYENGEKDLDNVVTTTYKKLKLVYDSIKSEDPCNHVNSINNGMVNIEFGKGNCIRLSQKEIYKTLVRCRKKV